MGLIILAADDSEFRVGDYIVMHREMTCLPTAPRLHVQSSISMMCVGVLSVAICSSI